MNKLALYTTHLYGQLLAAWRHRRVYPSRREAWRALGLRLVAIRSLRRLTTPGVSLLHLRGVGPPLAVRRASSDYWVLEEIYECGEYAAIKRLALPPDAGVIDLGANIGLASRYIADLLPRCRIVAVEPDRDNCAMIGRNCRDLIEQGRLEVVTAFVAAEPGVAAIDRLFDSYGFTMVAAAGRPADEHVECLTADRLFERLGRDEVDLLKCDIEGTERELFGQCRPWVHRVRHMVVETHVPYSLPALYADLGSAGWPFEVVSQDEKGGRSVALLRRRDV
jgi:FkbM family methyltransferase